MSRWLVARASDALDRVTSRRGFLMRAAIVGSALAVDPLDYLLHPGTAYAAVCTCGDPACGCGSPCCDGYTEFCCVVYGSNSCPPGTVAGGWWRADGSNFCGGGPRYYIDCHGECTDDTCNDDGLSCGCAANDCNHRVAGCVSFRYGQCHQDIKQMGRIACRVVTCTPAYMLDNACTQDVLYDDATANHNAPCLQAPPFIRRAYATAVVDQRDLWFADHHGNVYPEGDAVSHGDAPGHDIVAMAATATGYWLTATDGVVLPKGGVGWHGDLGGDRLNAPIVGMAASATANGYWLVASDGGVFAFGDARFFGSMGGQPLQQPIVAMTASANGYWLVASDGGVFAFGDARYYGSMGGQPLRNFVAGLVPSPRGYWLWAQDGSVFAFGDAVDQGDYRRLPSDQQDLPSDGIDAFYAMASVPGGYSLWAASPLGPPPGLHRYDFVPTPPPTTTTLLPRLPLP